MTDRDKDMPKQTTKIAQLTSDDFARIQVEMYGNGKRDSMVSLREALRCIPESAFTKRTILDFMGDVVEALTGELH